MPTSDGFKMDPGSVWSEKSQKATKGLPGMGGVFNPVNLNAYSYTYNNPIIFFDPDGNSGWLVINSSGNGGSSMTSGHSWIAYTPDDTGSTTTYGTWGNNPGGLGNGLHENLESGRTGDATRKIYLSDAQETKLMNVISQYKKKGENGWKYGAPCSSFARKAWKEATDEDLNSNWGPISNPTTLKESIVEANGGKAHNTMVSPNTESSASSGSSGRFSGSSLNVSVPLLIKGMESSR